MHPFEQTKSRASAIRCFSGIHISPGERRSAELTLRQAEMVADMIQRANEDLYHIARFVGRGIRALVRRSKVSTATPESRLP